MALSLATPLAAGGNAQPVRDGNGAPTPDAPEGGVEKAAEAVRPAPKATPPATGACAEAIAAKVQTFYDGVEDLEADFEQRTRSAAFGQAAGFDAPAAGRVAFAKPGKMRWTYQTPQASEVISNGSMLWVYDPQAKEVQVLEVGEAFLSAAAIQFMLGSGQLLESFRVTAKGCDQASVTLHLLPKEDATYEYLELEVSAASGAIEVTRVADLLGNRTEVRFRGVKTNQSPPATRFQFETPAGVRELRLPSR